VVVNIRFPSVSRLVIWSPRRGQPARNQSIIVLVGNFLLKFAHPVFASVLSVERASRLSDMLEDILSEFESTGPVYTLWGESVP
jgi:hypothetical protein